MYYPLTAQADAWREQHGAAHQQGPVPLEMAKYAQMLAGRHWRPPQASNDAAAAAGAAGGRASVAGAPRNAWQVYRPTTECLEPLKGMAEFVTLALSSICSDSVVQCRGPDRGLLCSAYSISLYGVIPNPNKGIQYREGCQPECCAHDAISSLGI